MQEHHWIERRDSGYSKITICEWTTMSNSHSISRKSLELLSVLISELVVLAVHRVCLESNSQCVQDRIIVFELNFIRRLLKFESLLNVHSFNHFLRYKINY